MKKVSLLLSAIAMLAVGLLSGCGSSTEKGSITVTITPTAAITAGAKWTLDGASTTYASGAKVAVAPGVHTVAFTTVSGFTTPTAQEAVVSSNKNVSVSGAYVEQAKKATLTVNITPAAAVTAGAKWSVDGGTTTYASGASATLAAGTYTVTFTSISGFTAPGTQSVTLAAGGSQTVTGAYTAVTDSGTLTVTATPTTAVQAGAKWSVDGGKTSYASGATETLAAGTYTLTFLAVDGFTAPASQKVTVEAKKAATATGAYTLNAGLGVLVVNIEPAAAVTAGAQWSLDGGTTWHAANTAVAVQPGTYTVTFKSVTGFVSPSTATTIVAAGKTSGLTILYTESN